MDPKDPIEELAGLDIDALWQRVHDAQPPEATEFHELVRRLQQEYKDMQASEDARLAAGKKRRKGAKAPKATT